MPLQCFTGEHLATPVSFFSPFDLWAPFPPQGFSALISISYGQQTEESGMGCFWLANSGSYSQ